METNRNKRLIKRMCFILIWGMIHMVNASITVVSNKAFAVEVPFTEFQETQRENSTRIRESLSDAIFKFVDFIKTKASKSTSETLSSSNITINTPVKDELVLQEYFSDILYNKDRFYINYLAKEKIVSTNQEKFYPNNFIRLNELSKILVNSYRYKIGYKLDGNVGLSNKNYFDKLMPKYYNTAYEMGLLNGLDNIDDYERFVSYDDLDQILQNFKRQYPELINLYYVDIDKSILTIKRGDIARIVFRTLMLDSDKNVDIAYQDIYYNTNFDAIQTLASLGITNTENSRFYPDDNISRGDFIVMFVKSYLKKTNKTLEVSKIDFDIEDLDYNSIYAPYVLYAKEHGLVDYLLEIVRTKKYINLEKLITKHEAYYIVSNIANVSFDYNILEADKEFISRGESAQLMVDAFAFSSKSGGLKNNPDKNDVPNSQLEKFVTNVRGLMKSPKLSWIWNQTS
ncbi:MAG TPA: S-layer homology domain-containing protein [Candidatus Absconditabacterales bacterium]|nr:S-layer homology domain-containing protein [Candidatus Absconditabacterales bacterium]